MRSGEEFIKAVDELINKARENNMIPMVYVDYGEGPYVFRRAESVKNEVTLEYADWDYEEEEEVMCSTTILASDISRVRRRGNEIRGVDEDEEEFRVVLEPLPPPPKFSDNRSVLGPWHEKKILKEIEKKQTAGKELNDEEYVWLTRAMVLWSTELDWMVDSDLSLGLAEWLNADQYLIRNGEFDAQGFVDNFEVLSECPEEAYETWADMRNAELYEPSSDAPRWAEELSRRTLECSKGCESVRLHSALRVVLKTLVGVAKDLHRVCHPDTGYKMRTEVSG